MYPSLIGVTRECTKPTTLRGTDVTVEKGIMVLVPILGLHHDPKYYPDPERFDPERFNVAEKKKRPQFCYLPFGEGPRMCIGSVYICNVCKSQ
jgi:cytochrome P450